MYEDGNKYVDVKDNKEFEKALPWQEQTNNYFF